MDLVALWNDTPVESKIILAIVFLFIITGALK
jgi:hypothetical protein